MGNNSVKCGEMISVPGHYPVKAAIRLGPYLLIAS